MDEAEAHPEYFQSDSLSLHVWYGRVDGRPAIVGVELWGIKPIVREWVRHSSVGQRRTPASGDSTPATGTLT